MIATEQTQRCRPSTEKVKPVVQRRGERRAWIRTGLAWITVAVLALQAAYEWPQMGFLMVLYLFALVQLAEADSWRKAFYPGLSVGLLISVLKLEFFWRIFPGGAVALWLIYSFWIGLFVASARLSLRRFSRPWNWVAIPFLWCGLEYFRSELYYLRFSWVSPGFAFSGAPGLVPFHQIGAYGLSFLFMGLACGAAFLWKRRLPIQSVGLLLLGAGVLRTWALLGQPGPASVAAPVHVAGVQMEFPTEKEVVFRLNKLIQAHPETELLVLSEYTFTDPLPDKLKDWCRSHQRHLIVGAKDPLANGQFYNTAFVIAPNGEIVFRQAKSVPIQFFKDGLPAPEQRVWTSPWGRIGICICYDLSYSRVTDRLVRLGAQALIVPTMDVVDWGQRQHALHARVAPVRAAEYGVPIFRLASSGISQLVDRRGNVLASAPCPGDGAVLSGVLELRNSGRLPLDRWLAPFATGVAGLALVWFAVRSRPRTRPPI